MTVAEGGSNLFGDPMLTVLGLVEQGGGWDRSGVWGAFSQIFRAGKGCPLWYLSIVFAPMNPNFSLSLHHSYQLYDKTYYGWVTVLDIYFCFAYVITVFPHGRHG